MIPFSNVYTDHTKHEYSCKEEFSDWPNGLLAIGTFGNNHHKQSEKLFSNQDHTVDATAEDHEFEQADHELRLLLKNIDPADKQQNLSVEELLDCLLQHGSVSENKGTHLQRNASRGRKDIGSDKKQRGIARKSLSFLIKKTFLCRGGFGPETMLRDPLPDHKLDHSRMEKVW